MKPVQEREWEEVVKRDTFPNVNRSIFVRKDPGNSWRKLQEGHEGNYYMTTMLRALYDLAAAPGGNRRRMQQKVFGPCKMFYEFRDSGDIQVDLFVVEETLADDANNQSGLYRAEWLSEKSLWGIPKSAHAGDQMELGAKWGYAHMAAVPGKFDSARAAAEKMGLHVENAWLQRDERKEYRKSGNHFSLFWMKNEFTSKTHQQTLVSLIQIAQRKNENLRWLVHGEATATFIKALEYLNSNPVSSDIHKARQGLKQQAVYFSNPRGKGASESALKELCSKSGITFGGVRVNSADVAYNPDARSAMISELSVLGAKIGITGASAAAGVPDLLKSLDMAVGATSAFAAGGFLAAGYVLFKDAYSKNSGFARNTVSAFQSTFGKANENWAA